MYSIIRVKKQTNDMYPQRLTARPESKGSNVADNKSAPFGNILDVNLNITSFFLSFYLSFFIYSFHFEKIPQQKTLLRYFFTAYLCSSSQRKAVCT